jgi:hypothetical protein
VTSTDTFTLNFPEHYSAVNLKGIASDVSGGKKGKALNVIPMAVGKK